MQIRENYDKDVFNGDLGRIRKIDLIEQDLVVEIDDREVRYEFGDTDELLPAYAISIHKSQGNEYPCVIVPVLTQHYVLLQRNLLYTAITRGKRLVVLIGSKKRWRLRCATIGRRRDTADCASGWPDSLAPCKPDFSCFPRKSSNSH